MNEELLRESRILIVDDQVDNVHLLERLLNRRGFVNLRSITDPRLFFPTLAEFQPDLILLDLQMPFLDGYEILEQLSLTLSDEVYLPVLVLTANIGPEAKKRALELGAKDFLHKPFESTEVVLRIRNLLHTRHLHQRVLDDNLALEFRVRERTRELEEAKLEMLFRLARAAEFRDDNTGNHQHRVGSTTALIAERLGLPADQVETLRLAALLHDIGKIGIPDAVLLKPGKLTPDEFHLMQQHTTIGAAILTGSRYPVLIAAEEIALTHHEHWDGQGYPHGLAGEAIPLAGRIVAVADVFDALTHERSYKEAWPVTRAANEITRMSGLHLDPNVVRVFLDLVAEGLLPVPDDGHPH